MSLFHYRCFIGSSGDNSSLTCLPNSSRPPVEFPERATDKPAQTYAYAVGDEPVTHPGNEEAEDATEKRAAENQKARIIRYRQAKPGKEAEKRP